MEPTRRAVIDIGTNSVKLLVAEVAGGTVTPLLEQSEQTRLGRGFYEIQRLQPEAIRQTAQAVAEFARLAGEFAPASVRVIATSAARDALNAEELVAAIQQTAGLPVEVISGEQEADWAFLGVASDPVLACQALLILDVGGGSTEFILGEGAHQNYRQSFPLGTVRLLEQRPPSDPPAPSELAQCLAGLDDFLTEKVVPGLTPVLQTLSPRRVQLIGTGGTTSIVARILMNLADFNREQIEATSISRRQMRDQLERLWKMPLAERQQINGLPPNRADVILFGLAIYERVMTQFDFSELRVSTRGLRFAALMTA